MITPLAIFPQDRAHRESSGDSRLSIMSQQFVLRAGVDLDIVIMVQRPDAQPSYGFLEGRLFDRVDDVDLDCSVHGLTSLGVKYRINSFVNLFPVFFDERLDGSLTGYEC